MLLIGAMAESSFLTSALFLIPNSDPRRLCFPTRHLSKDSYVLNPNLPISSPFYKIIMLLLMKYSLYITQYVRSCLITFFYRLTFRFHRNPETPTLLPSLFYRRRNKDVKRFCYLTKITNYRVVKPDSDSI